MSQVGWIKSGIQEVGCYSWNYNKFVYNTQMVAGAFYKVAYIF